MREAGIHAMAKKKYKATTDSRHTQLVAPNHLNRNFSVNKLKSVLGGRYHLPLYPGRLALLSTIMDLYSRKIIGWSMKNRITPDLVIEALNMAIKQKKSSWGLLLHSDRGSQYKSYCYQALLGKRGILCSMSRKGNCFR
jgi:transposase InsO family protein